MAKPDFEVVWQRILANEGKTFSKVRGDEFSYQVIDDVLHFSGVDRVVSKDKLREIYKLVPLDGPGQISSMVSAPSYVWGIFDDNRISKGNW